MKTKTNLLNRLNIMMKTNNDPELATLYKKVEESRSVKEVNVFKTILNSIVKSKKVKYEWSR